MDRFVWIPEAPNHPGLYALPTPDRRGKLGTEIHYGTGAAGHAVQHETREESQRWCDEWNAAHPEVASGRAWAPQEHGFYDWPAA